MKEKEQAKNSKMKKDSLKKNPDPAEKVIKGQDLEVDGKNDKKQKSVVKSAKA